MKQNKIILPFLFVLLLASSAFSAPGLNKSIPEPLELPGRTLQQRFSPGLTSGHMLAPASYPTATINILFLRVEFQEDPAPVLSQTSGNGLWSDPTYANNGDPDFWVKRARTKFVDYWREVSYGMLPIQVDMSQKVYQLPHVMASYGNESEVALQNLFYDGISTALTDTDLATRPTISNYDAVLVVHAGVGQESDQTGATPNDIWSLYYSVDNYGGTGICHNASGPCLTIPLKGGRVISEAIIMPQTDSRTNIIVDPLGVYVHEFGHWLGLPDLYCTSLFCQLDGVGRWSLMGDGIYNFDPADTTTVTGNLHWYGSSPAHLDAWSKVFLRWTTPVAADTASDLGSRSLSPVESNGEIIRLQASSSTNSQYFLLENRQQVGFDKGLPGHGLLVWLVDDTVVNANIQSNTINNNRYRPGVKLVEADNDWMLLSNGCGVPDDCGSAGDPFPGSTVNRALTPTTSPSSRAYDPEAWVNIRNISEPGQLITAEIGFGPLPPGLPGMTMNAIVWQPNTDPDVAGYRIYRNALFAAQTTGTSYVDPLARNRDAYQVTAIDSQGNESDYSGLVIANMAASDGGGGGRCFIATAAYGSSLDPHVRALRKFRDQRLMTNAAGRMFVEYYYRTSPPVAEFISNHDSARAVVRWTLAPVVYTVEYPGIFLALMPAGVALMVLVLLRKKNCRRILRHCTADLLPLAFLPQLFHFIQGHIIQ